MNKFICIEGPDGAGKTTQAKLLSERIENSLLVHEPGTTSIGLKIRQILLDPENKIIGNRTELLLFMAARAQLIDEVIKPALDSGKIVIADRFLPSTVAYQQGFRIQQIMDIGEFSTRNILPDVTFLLDVEPEIALNRKRAGDKDRIERKDLEFHHQVRNRYRNLANMEPGSFVVLDGAASIEAVHDAIWGDLIKKGMVN